MFSELLLMKNARNCWQYFTTVMLVQLRE